MKIILISDTHTFHGYLNLPTDADMIVHSGDISSRGHKHEVLNFFTWYSSLPYKYKIFIAGNHDFLFENDPDFIKENLPENLIYLENSGIEIEGLKIWGSPIQPYFRNWAFNRFRGEDINKYWQMIPTDTNYLITHGPAYKIHDMVNNFYNPDVYVGCKDLKNRLFMLPELKIFQFGHIHEARGHSEVAHFHAFKPLMHRL
jgi:Icc-related predicted phosphoesterase